MTTDVLVWIRQQEARLLGRFYALTRTPRDFLRRARPCLRTGAVYGVIRSLTMGICGVMQARLNGRCPDTRGVALARSWIVNGCRSMMGTEKNESMDADPAPPAGGSSLLATVGWHRRCLR